MKLIIGNKRLSSWSLRGWLACRQSGLPFEEVVVPLYGDDWPRRRLAADIAFAPVVTRFGSDGVQVPALAAIYMDAVRGHEWMQAWATAAAEEN